MNQFTKLVVILSFFLVKRTTCIDVVGNREVKYMSIPQNWFTAYEICRAYGMQLLTIHNERENEQVLALADIYKAQSAFWLGGNDLGHTGDYVWTGTGLKVVNAWWGPGQPDNPEGGKEHCLEITYQWPEPKWNDCPCDYNRVFFCEEVRTFIEPPMYCASVHRC